MKDNFKMFPIELLKNFCEDFFEIKKEDGKISVVRENMLYRVEVPVETPCIDCDEVVLKEIKQVGTGAEILCLTEGGEEIVLAVRGDGKVEFYDTRPADMSLFTPFEIISECADAALSKHVELGDGFLNGAEKELLSASPFIDFLEEPKFVEVATAEHLAAAAEYTKNMYPEISAEFSSLAAVKGSRFIKIRGTKKIKELLCEHLEQDFDEKKFLMLCDKANDGCAEKDLLEKEKFESVKESLTYMLAEAGYTGTFPNFTKDEKYIRFGISYLNYENENGEFFYDLSAAFGKGGKKPAAYRDILNDDKLSLPALSLTDDEREEKLAMYIRSIDLILEGKRPPREFFELDGIKMSEILSPSIMRKCAALLIVFGIVFAILGFYWEKEAFGAAVVLTVYGAWLFFKSWLNRVLVPCKKEKI